MPNTVNRNYPLPVPGTPQAPGNTLAVDVQNIINALTAIDADVAAALVAAAAKANLASPAFTGVPTAPTAAAGTDSAQIATTAFIKVAISNAVNALLASAPGTLDTLDELAAALGDNPNAITEILAALGNRLRFDAAQTLTNTQAAQVFANLQMTSTDAEWTALVEGSLRASARGQAEVLVSGVDLNTVTTSGCYQLPPTIVNGPAFDGTYSVMIVAGRDQKLQLIVGHNSSKIWVRGGYGTVWLPWLNPIAEGHADARYLRTNAGVMQYLADRIGFLQPPQIYHHADGGGAVLWLRDSNQYVRGRIGHLDAADEVSIAHWAAPGDGLRLGADGVLKHNSYTVHTDGNARSISPQFTVSASGSATWAHGLGSAIGQADAYFECVGAELGYAVGEMVPFHGWWGNTDKQAGTVAWGTTNVTVRFAGTFSIYHKSTGAQSTPTPGNWRLRFVARR